jgi:biotin transport system substrate-specific component
MLTTRDFTLAALMAALTAVGAFVTVPLGPVPFTLQPLFVMLAGLVLGWRLGALSMVIYLVVGLVAPVYHGGTSGLGVLVGPTGGYLWGFVVAAALTGALAQRLKATSLAGLFAAAVVGLVPIYVLGATWLAWQLHTTSFHVVIWGGVLEFLPLDVVKALLAAAACRTLAAAPLRLPVTASRRQEGSHL